MPPTSLAPASRCPPLLSRLHSAGQPGPHSSRGACLRSDCRRCPEVRTEREQQCSKHTCCRGLHPRPAGRFWAGRRQLLPCCAPAHRPAATSTCTHASHDFTFPNHASCAAYPPTPTPPSPCPPSHCHHLAQAHSTPPSRRSNPNLTLATVMFQLGDWMGPLEDPSLNITLMAPLDSALVQSTAELLQPGQALTQRVRWAGLGRGRCQSRCWCWWGRNEVWWWWWWWCVSVAMVWCSGGDVWVRVQRIGREVASFSCKQTPLSPLPCAHSKPWIGRGRQA